MEVKDGALLKCVSGEFVMGRNGYDWFKNDIVHCGVMLGAKDGGLLKCVMWVYDRRKWLGLVQKGMGGGSSH